MNKIKCRYCERYNGIEVESCESCGAPLEFRNDDWRECQVSKLEAKINALELQKSIPIRMLELPVFDIPPYDCRLRYK